MKEKSDLRVRELERSDIDHITRYWLESSPDFLVGMGVDLAKLPSREGLGRRLSEQLRTPLDQKASYALIWTVDGEPAGHCNANRIEFGEHAYMHLHLWHSGLRQRGIGTELVKRSLPWFFERLQLQQLFCEPYALNPAPNKTLEKVGFTLEKEYVTVPGAINFEQKVKRWRLSRQQYREVVGD